MSTDGVLGGVWLPTDGWLDPSGLAQALAAGARQRGATIRTAHAGRRASASSAAASPASTVEHRGERSEIAHRRRRQRRRHVRPRDRAAGRRDRADHPDGAPVPVHRGHRGRPSGPAAAARPGPPRLLPRGGRRAVHGRLRARPGAVVARRHPGRLQRQAARARPARFEPIMEGAIRRVPAMADARVSRIINGPEAFTPGQRVHPRRVARSAASGWPPGSAPTASPAPAASAARWRAGSSTASPSSTCGRWTSAGSARPTGRGRTRWRARSRTTRPTTTSTTRTRSARPAGRCARRRPTTASPRSARSSARSPAGSARTGSSRTRTTRGSAAGGARALRPRGWAGQHWSPAIAAEALATRQAAGLFDESLVRQARGRRTGRLRVPPAGRRQRHRPRRSARSSTRSCSTARGGIAGRPHRHPPRRRTGSCS